jgi:hypothetical protein
MHGVGTARTAAAADASGTEGDLERPAVRIRWRLNHYGKFSPEATVLLENRSEAPLGALLDFHAKVCGGKPVELTSEAGRYYKCEIESGIALVPVKASGWNAIVFSLGVPTADHSDSAQCTSEIRIRISQAGEEVDDVTISIPHPPGGWPDAR